MKKSLFKIMVIICVYNSLFGNKVKAAEISGSASSSAISAYSTYYAVNIPANVKAAFESEGGRIDVFPENASTSTAYTAGWSNGSTGTVTGYSELSSTPIVHINAKMIDRAINFYPGTACKALCHEMGHYVNVKSVQNKTGVKSYSVSTEFVNAFASEGGNWASSKDMSATLKSSFSRNIDVYEYYANIFAGICTEPIATMNAFPVSYSIVLADMASI